jgi:hypothetical protein
MKIKAPSRRNLIRSRAKAKAFHYWLLPEKPKKSGRIGQLNKHNHRSRKPSEFVIAASETENDPTKGGRY